MCVSVCRLSLRKMAAAWLLLLAVASPGVLASTPARRSVAVLPHDTYPGYSVKKFPSTAGYRLLETGFSQFFTVLRDGLLMTTADLAPLVNRRVDLVVLEEAPNRTATHSLQLYVLDRRDMLRFREPLYEGGRVSEGAAPGTVVDGLPPLQVTGGGGGGVTYAIVAGDESGVFALQRQHRPTMAPSSNNDSATWDAGVKIVTRRPLDREKTPAYTLTVEAADGRGVDKAVTKVRVEVLDENDNSPVFASKVYRFTVAYENVTERFRSVGTVSASDVDGDRVAYRLAAPSGLVVVVPQTGDLLLAEAPPLTPGEDMEYEIAVEAHDLRVPSRTSETPAQVWLQFLAPPLPEDADVDQPSVHRIEKRRVTRAVRPTKRIEFTEADGETEGRIVFQLEKETERETFKIRDENPWVTVEPNGAVRVKKKWDYEELGPEKTIDFWVTITNTGGGGEYSFNIAKIFLHCRRHVSTTGQRVG